MIIYSLIDPLLPLTMEQFNKIPDGEIFAKGELPDNGNGINMTGTGRNLKWLAKKGFGNDWAIYCWWARTGMTNDNEPPNVAEKDEADPYETYWDYIKINGDKVKDETNIRRCISVSDEVMKLYRF